MRVFYPISARLADFVNDEAQMAAQGMMLWGLPCIALLMLVLSALPSFEAGATQQREYFSNHHFSHAVHVMGGRTQQNIGNAHASKPLAATNRKTHVSTQDYIDAHRCAQYFACFTPVAGPAKPKAAVDRYL